MTCHIMVTAAMRATMGVKIKEPVSPSELDMKRYGNMRSPLRSSNHADH